MGYVQPVRRDPLTLDLDGDGLETVGTAAGILFDQTSGGIKTGTGWVKPDDGFLVLDRNGNGAIDNGRELFGDSTIKSNGQLALDGFDALRDLDSNANGKLDSGDAQFGNLKVWRDLNQDGTSQNGELFTLGQLNIASINTGSTSNSQTLPNGNQIADLGTYTRTDGSTGTTGEVKGNLGDINLAQDNFHRQFTTHPDTSAVANLPDMQGSGAVRDLREAASQSPALAATLAQLGADTSVSQLKSAVELILQQWADGANFNDSFESAAAIGKDLFFVPPGVSTLNAYNAHYHGLLGTYYANTNGGTPSSAALTDSQLASYDSIRAQQAQIERMIKTLDAFNGRDFVPISPNGNTGGSTLAAFATGTPGTTSNAGGLSAFTKTPALYNMEQARYDLLKQSYDHLVDSVYSALVTQTRLKPYLDAISLTVDSTGISLDYTGLNGLLDSKQQTHAASALYDLVELNKYVGSKLYTSGWDGVTKLQAWVDQAAGNPALQAVLTEMDVKVGTSLNGADKTDLLFGQAGNDSLYGNNGNDILSGGAGNDYLDGGNGNDVLSGGAGNDQMNGGAGNDLYLFSRGGGQDTIYSNDNAAGRVDKVVLGSGILPTDVALTRNGSDLVISINGTTDTLTVRYYFDNDGAGGYRIDAITFANGSSWAVPDINRIVLQGTSGNDTRYGYATNDSIDGLAGNDYLYGGGGNDSLTGGAGNDYLSGDGGADTYHFGRGFGSDTINNNESVNAGSANPVDAIVFDAGITPADISVTRNFSGDLFLKINGTTDTLTVQSYFYNDGASNYAVEEIRFADGTVWTVDNLKTLALIANDSGSTLIGFSVDDVINGGTGVDNIYGREGNDTLEGNNGDDGLFGETGNDSLSGSAGRDYLVGGDGNDILDGGAGNDQLTGDAGADTYRFVRGSGQDTVNNYENLLTGGINPVDTIELGTGIAPTDIEVRRSAYNELILSIKGTTDSLIVSQYFINDATSVYAVEQITFADGTVWDIAAVKAKALEATDNADRLAGYATDDTLSGMGGADSIYGAAGNDTLDGGAGNDTLYGNEGNDDLKGGADSDTLYGNQGNDTLDGGAGNDTLYGDEGDDNLKGGADSDALYGRLGNDTLEGGQGNDLLDGGDGDDTYLFGLGDGHDTLSEQVSSLAGAGNDTVQMRAGVLASEVKISREGNDVILSLKGQTIGDYYVYDSLRLKGVLVNDGDNTQKIERVVFDDGTVWTFDEIKARLMGGTEGNDTLYGFATSDSINGNGGDDTIYGMAGADNRPSIY